MNALDSLVRSAQQGDKDAFGVLVRHYQNMAYGVSYARVDDPDVAQDVAQEAFVDAYLSLDKLREPAAFSGWFYRILVKYADRVLRARRVMVSPDVLLTLPSEWPDPYLIAEANEVHSAVSELPERHRLAVVLYHLEGYSQKEVAEFLGVPVSTIKKRLFDARKRLKARMTMAEETIVDVSADDAFARKVQFFIALKTGDIETLKKLVKEDGSLVHAKTEFHASIPDRAHWQPGLLPVSWAAGMGHEELLGFLLDNGAEIDAKTKGQETPLHHAVLSGRLNTAKLLVEKGADVLAVASCGQSVLHRAALRGDRDIVDFLVQSGADVKAKDDQGYTAADWGALKGWPDVIDRLVRAGADKPKAKLFGAQTALSGQKRRKVPVGRSVLGRTLDHMGQATDGLGEVVLKQPVLGLVNDTPSPILETGIKAVDLFAPFMRGGHIVVEPSVGVGLYVLLAQIARNVIVHQNGQVVVLGLEDMHHTAKGMADEWRDGHGGDGKVLDENVVRIFGKIEDNDTKRRQLVETGLSVAESFRQEGHEVLLIVDGHLAQTSGVVPFLKTHQSITPEAAITTLYMGMAPFGLEVFGDLDALVSFSPERGYEGSYPCIDPVHSKSKLLSSNRIPEDHKKVVREAQDVLYQYYGYNLHGAYQKLGLDFTYLEDAGETEALILRARRLAYFLTQPFHGTEIWCGIPGQTIALEDALKGCREILEGKYNDVPERAFFMVGTVEMALEKAKTLT